MALVILIIGVPVAAFTLWPLLRRGGASVALLPVPPDASEQLAEQKRQVLRVLRELQFEHDAGHVSDDDYADLRARYEAEAAQILTELDRVQHARSRPEPPPRSPASTPSRSAWRHPLALAAGGAALVVFGVALGAGITRYAAPDPSGGMPAPGTRPLASLEPPASGGSGPRTREVSPDMLRGMLQAARASLREERYGEAIAAYQAVLKRDPKNVDALTHLGLIVAIGGHADPALETFERALTIDPNYPPALLYRGQVLYDAKRDTAGAIRSWEKFLKVVPTGEDHARVQKLITEARARK